MNINNRIKAMRKNKLFLKILMYFLCLLLPILVIGFIAYFNLLQWLGQDVSTKLVNNLTASSKKIDDNLEMAQYTQMNLLFNGAVQQNLHPYQELISQNKSSLPQLIAAIAYSRSIVSSIVDTMYLYIDNKRIYRSDGADDFNFFFDSVRRYEKYGASFWQNKLLNNHNFEVLEASDVSTLGSDTKKKVIPILSAQYIEGHMTVLVSDLSVHAMSKLMVDNSLFPDTRFFIMDQQGRLIVDTESFSEAEINEITAGFYSDQSPTLKMKLQGQPSLVARVSSETIGWSYYSITPETAYNYQASSMLSFIFWVCLILIVFGVILSLIFSINLYNPIRNMRDVLIQSETTKSWDDEMGGNELAAIDRGIRKLLETNEIANRRFSLFSSEFLDNAFTSLIRGVPLVHQESFYRMLKEVGFENGRYLCCCILFRFRDAFYDEIQDTERFIILEKLKKVIWGVLQQHVICYLIEYEQNTYVSIVKLDPNSDKSKLMKGLENIKQTFGYDVKYCDMVIGVGKDYQDIQDIVKSYYEAITAIGNKPDHGDMVIMDATHLQIEHSYYYSFLDENKIINGLKFGDLEFLERSVDELFKMNKNRGASHQYLDALLSELFSTGNRFLAGKKLDLHSFLSEKEHLSFSSKGLLPHEFHARTKLLLTFYQRIIGQTATKPKRKTNQVVPLIVAYINEHYSENLYLEMIADEMGMSPKYISRIFKETTGQNLTDYISLIRINKAKQYLSETSLLISDISTKVGIHSRSTFLRLFKKYEGITPMDYRIAFERESP
ncbi:helix-turn-helix domain-containing protein [Paenibacillus agricola]|uniref:AraC family transcriptional regulator n=1 Tax=Paenibacillus agricola TaxID=2716264 RepID=A0ABX0JF73_9BACL|nr:helix-turn-helix domain-containing protein [Paenibacillus agricola]NHN32516.1 AraC family transcriptional regulator [Paenibacillus agricola]